MQSNLSQMETLINRSRDHDADVLSFLDEIGIEVREQELKGDYFLPGLKLEKGVVYVDLSRILSIGDILHEAGHLAVTESKLRPLIGTEQMSVEWPTSGDEIATIIWSFAAASHLKIPLEVLFHPQGYKGESEWLIESFFSGNYIGLPLLEWMNLCFAEGNQPENTAPFPNMTQWLRD